MAETEKHAATVAPYVTGKNTLDIGGSGWPICKTAIQLDLPEEAYLNYNRTTRGEYPIHLRGDCRDLFWFKDGVLDVVHASHVLEDFRFEEWGAILREWTRVIKSGGVVIIACPSHSRFRFRVSQGQGNNCAHKFEPELTDLPKWFATWQIVHNDYTSPEDYSMLFIARKLPQSTITEVPMSEMSGAVMYV